MRSAICSDNESFELCQHFLFGQKDKSDKKIKVDTLFEKSLTLWHWNVNPKKLFEILSTSVIKMFLIDFTFPDEQLCTLYPNCNDSKKLKIQF